MAYLIRCLYRPGGDQRRFAVRARHIEHMLRWLPRTVFGSALLEEGTGKATGMLVALDVPDRAGALEFLESEPYYCNDLFETIDVSPLKQMTPPYTPELLLAELARETGAVVAETKAIP